MSDTTEAMLAFVAARLDEAHEKAVSDEQRRYVQAMRNIVALHEDVEPLYRSAIAAGDKASIEAWGHARWAVMCAIGFIATARNDHAEFDEGWAP